MCLSTEDAAVIVVTWPSELSLKQRFTLLRQLSSLKLPEEDLKKWLAEAAK